MSIPMDAECVLCHLQRNIEMAQGMGSAEAQTAFAKDLMRLHLSAPDWASSPYLGPGTNDLFQKHFGVGADRYREEKEQANQVVFARLEKIRSYARQAEDPVYAALQLSILGNYLDFAIMKVDISDENMDRMLKDAGEMRLDKEVYAQLQKDLASGKKLLYFTDNAGEIGFDRIFAEEIQRKYPHLEITFCVRGGITQNDATREDARVMQLPFRIVDSGNTVAGTEISLLGEEATQALNEADVIIAKGMGNVETMYGCGYNVYYAFLVKCGRLMRFFQKSMMEPMLVREKQK